MHYGHKENICAEEAGLQARLHDDRQGYATVSDIDLVLSLGCIHFSLLE